MRAVRYSVTFNDQLNDLLAYGVIRFGKATVREKRAAIHACVNDYLAVFPRTKRRHRRLKLTVYHVTDTPFVLLCDFDDVELRVHFIFHKSASLKGLNPKSAIW